MNLAQRLIFARELRGLSQQQLAEISGVNQQTISNIETEVTKKPRFLPELAKALNIDLNWLASGKGMSPADLPNQTEPINAVTRPPIIDWSKIDSLLQHKIKPTELKLSDFYVSKRSDDEKPIFCLIVNNPAMTPPDNSLGIREGEEILVDTLMKPTSGAYVVAKFKSSYILRKYIEDGSDKYLEPHNPSYPKIKIDENVEIIGCVAAVRRKV